MGWAGLRKATISPARIWSFSKRWRTISNCSRDALLYKSLEQKAAEYHNLKDFSENIIESINVGVLVESVEGRVVGMESRPGKSHRAQTQRDAWQANQRCDSGSLSPKTLGSSIPVQTILEWVDGEFLGDSLVDKSGATRGN